MRKVNIFLDSTNILLMDLKGQGQIITTFFSSWWESKKKNPCVI